MLSSQVNKLFFKQCLVNQILRYTHSENLRQVLYPLESRKLLKIRGKDTLVYLQGLITNDMRHFEEGAQSIYAMFLNNKGRVLYDTILHKWEEGDSFLLECDKNVSSLLQKHLKMYKLKRIVDIEDVSDSYRLWTLIPSLPAPIQTNIDPKKNVQIYKDPRLSDLGYRVLSSTSMTGSDIARVIGKDIKVESNDDGYKYLRYKLGVSEGSEDLLPTACFPLEANCDYLHGVSFHKGCYIGQELTARVHHTGVVRKRMMPLKFNRNITEHIDKDAVIAVSDKPKSNIGKLKNYFQDYGLGLVRIKEALEAKSLIIGNYNVEVIKPTWWPIESPKEKVTAVKE